MAPPRSAGPSRNGGPSPWDLAMARLFPLRGQVSRITIVVEGREEVLFEE